MKFKIRCYRITLRTMVHALAHRSYSIYKKNISYVSPAQCFHSPPRPMVSGVFPADYINFVFHPFCGLSQYGGTPAYMKPRLERRQAVKRRFEVLRTSEFI